MGLADRAIAAISPGWALRRTEARARREMIQNSGYDQHGASRRKKALAGWTTQQGGPDSDITVNVETLRERSRDLCMGEGLAIGALRTIRTNEIGAGLRLNSQIDAQYLGLTEEAAQKWEDDVEREFCRWADNKECDAARRSTFGELQALARLSQLMSGDVFALLPAIPRRGDRYDLKVKLVEADVVCDPLVKDLKLNILQGVEHGEHGDPIAYYFADQHPGDLFTPGLRILSLQKWTRIPAFGEKTGRPLVLHLMESERPGQRRGVPILAPVMEKFKQLSRYSLAEIEAALVSACFTAAITTPTPQTPIGAVMTDGEKAQIPQGSNDFQMSSGLVVGLNPGEDIKGIDPTRPNSNFDAFVMAICRQIGVGIGVPYHVMMMVFDGSYNTSRAALLEFWKRVNVGRAWLASNFCQPVYESFLEESILRGYIRAPDFFSDPLARAAWCGAEWIGPTQGQLDPTKEVEAAAKRVEEGFSTRTRETMELTGGDFWANHRLRVREEEARVAGKVIPTPPTPGKVTPPAPQDQAVAA